MKDTCKRAIFRKDTRRVRRAEDPLRARDQEERELEFFNMFGDNKSVVTSSTVPHSLLSKRHNILSYHRVREAIAAKILVFHWCDSSQNKSDILSKYWEFSKVFHIIREKSLTSKERYHSFSRSTQD